MVQHLGDDQLVTALILLMPFHDIGGHVQVCLVGKTVYRAHGRQGLKAEFTHKAWELLAVSTERLTAVPNLPVMCVAAFLPVGVLEGGT